MPVHVPWSAAESESAALLGSVVVELLVWAVDAVEGAGVGCVEHPATPSSNEEVSIEIEVIVFIDFLEVISTKLTGNCYATAFSAVQVR